MPDYDPTSMEGVPEAGRARLAQNKRGLFTSDLSVNEFLLVKQAGFEPLGLVVGSSIYHIGIQLAGWKKSQEMTRPIQITMAMPASIGMAWAMWPNTPARQTTVKKTPFRTE